MARAILMWVFVTGTIIVGVVTSVTRVEGVRPEADAAIPVGSREGKDAGLSTLQPERLIPVAHDCGFAGGMTANWVLLACSLILWAIGRRRAVRFTRLLTSLGFAVVLIGLCNRWIWVQTVGVVMIVGIQVAKYGYEAAREVCRASQAVAGCRIWQKLRVLLGRVLTMVTRLSRRTR